MQDEDLKQRDAPSARPWIVLTTTYDVESWIDRFNFDLQQYVKNGNASGYGICFSLTEGGDVFLHTTPDGDVVLDVTPEAEWITPLIKAATREEAVATQIWHLPAHTLTQLVLGLSSLISTTRIVNSHNFKIKKY